MKKIRKLENEIAASHGKIQSASMERLYFFADKLIKREGYKNLSGLDAVYFFLIQKHNWLPNQVRSMNIEDLAFCLEEEVFN